METVWVIEQGSYSDYRVVGVFTSKAEGKIVLDAINATDDYDKAELSEWPLNPAVDELRKGYAQYFVQMQEDGTTDRCEKRDLSTYELSGSVRMWRRSQAPAYKGQGLKDVLHATIWAEDETHAVKIVNEHRTRMIATGEWYTDRKP